MSLMSATESRLGALANCAAPDPAAAGLVHRERSATGRRPTAGGRLCASRCDARRRPLPRLSPQLPRHALRIRDRFFFACFAGLAVDWSFFARFAGLAVDQSFFARFAGLAVDWS